jgi:hypothetical protein
MLPVSGGDWLKSDEVNDDCDDESGRGDENDDLFGRR